MTPAPEAARATLVLLHGRGHDPASMHELAGRFGADDVAVVAPAAPGATWYPERFVEPRAANEPHLSEATARVHALLDDLEARGVRPQQLLLGGFSQGACLAADVVATRPRPLGGLAALCGGLVGTQDELAAPGPGTLAGLPVVLTGTEDDAWVPVDRVRETAERLRAAGAEVELLVHPPAPHGIQPADVEALRALLAKL